MKKEIIRLINSGIDTFINGAARGFDMLSAETVIEMKKEMPDMAKNIRLILYLPCTDQNKSWNYQDKLRYNMLITQADEYIFVTNSSYTDGCMKKRNYKMVDDSCACIAYCTSKRSGTSQTMNYAEKCGCEVINLADF